MPAKHGNKPMRKLWHNKITHPKSRTAGYVWIFHYYNWCYHYLCAKLL